jgi:hypothetical protein
MLITIFKLLALVASFATVTTTLTFLSNDEQICWANVSQREIIRADICDEFHVFKNYWCEGVCPPGYTDVDLGYCKRNCPHGWLNFADFCAKPVPRPRRMSPLIWENS